METWDLILSVVASILSIGGFALGYLNKREISKLKIKLQITDIKHNSLVSGDSNVVSIKDNIVAHTVHTNHTPDILLRKDKAIFGGLMQEFSIFLAEGNKYYCLLPSKGIKTSLKDDENQAISELHELCYRIK